MKKYHIQARQQWERFSHEEAEYCLKHLDAHEVVFEGQKDTYKFVVTYGLHCFAKDDQPQSIAYVYSDGYESRQVDLERYHASKKLRYFIENLDQQKLIYEVTSEKYFTIELIDECRETVEKYKICICIFKENRLLRIHVTTAFLLREEKPLHQKHFSIFKLAMDVKRKPRTSNIPKEASRK